MSVATFALLVAVAATMGLTLVPVRVGLHRGFVMSAGIFLLQFASTIAALAFLVLSYRHLHLPLLGYARPSAVQLFGTVALVQLLAAWVGVRVLHASFAQKLSLVAISVFAALAAVFVGAGAVACAHGDCF